MSQIFYAEQADFHILKFVGDVRLSQSPLISNFLLKMRKLDNCCVIVVDLSETVAIDSTALGLIAKLGIICRESFALTLSIVSPRGNTIIKAGDIVVMFVPVKSIKKVQELLSVRLDYF